MMINNTLATYIESCKNNFISISEERKTKLKPLINYLNAKREDELYNLIFICTHNSRRSHLSQVWGQIAAYAYGVSGIRCYSGGTEATALFHSSAKALEDAGVHVSKLSNETNPVFTFKFADNEPPIVGFSKVYEDQFNPQSHFAAVMTCTSADLNCPFIPNCDTRISLPYEDPKAFDGTQQQEGKYAERSFEIATELLYVFSKVER